MAKKAKAEETAEKPTKKSKTKEVTPEITMSVGAAVDKLYRLREKRQAAQKVVDAIAEEEKTYSNYLINQIPKSDATGVSGKLATATIKTDEVPTVKD